MKKFISLLIALICTCVLSSGNVFANTYGGGLPQAVPYTYNGTIYDRYIVISRGDFSICSNTHALYFVSSEMTAVGWPNSTNYYSLVLGYDGNIPSFNTQPTGSHQLSFDMWNNNGVCTWNTTPEFETTYTQGAPSLRADAANAILNHNFDLYTRDYVPAWGTLPYTFSGSYSSWGSWALDALNKPAQFLSFPLSAYTPYTAPVSSVMDHSMTAPYAEDDIVLAFNGERGDKGYGFSLGCYKKSSGGNFGTGFNYVGTTGTGGKPYFCYDGHPGYDYAVSQNTDILAPAAGVLCVASDTISAPSPAEVWRYTTKCPIDSVVSTRWTIPNSNGYNTFYILHGELTINGSTNEYMTVFLHNADLSSVVRTAVQQNGYADVTRLQHVAEVGNVGAGGYHMHLEVYKKVSGSWSRVDSYGDGTNNILWQH